MTIEDNIRARKDAELLIGMRQIELGPGYELAFARACMNHAVRILGCNPYEPMAMNEDESRNFEQHQIKFGKYSGTAYKDIPVEYLTFLDDAARPVQAYLRSERGKKRIESESDD